MKKFTQIIALVALTIGMLSPIGPVACSKTTLSADGVYQGDKTLYSAEKTITTAYKSFDAFLKWEETYRAALPVDVSRAADTVRLNAKKWIDSASAMRDAYASSPTKENRDKLQLTLSLIDTALAESLKYMQANKSIAPAPPSNLPVKK